MFSFFFFFFFQAEDGIRDLYETGVQTCALPISPQYLGELPRVFPCADEAREDRVVDLLILGESLRHPLPALDAFEDPGDHFAKPGVFHAVAQIDQRFDERDPGSGELLHVEAEVDELRALDRARAEQAPPVPGWPAPHQVQAHALQAHLEVDDIHRVNLAEHRLAPSVYGLVGEKRHVRSRSRARSAQGYIRSVRSTTRISSSSAVEPSRTRRAPSSASVRKPLATAALCSCRPVARCAISSSSSASIFRISMIAMRPR